MRTTRSYLVTQAEQLPLEKISVIPSLPDYGPPEYTQASEDEKYSIISTALREISEHLDIGLTHTDFIGDIARKNEEQIKSGKHDQELKNHFNWPLEVADLVYEGIVGVTAITASQITQWWISAFLSGQQVFLETSNSNYGNDEYSPTRSSFPSFQNAKETARNAAGGIGSANQSSQRAHDEARAKLHAQIEKDGVRPH